MHKSYDRFEPVQYLSHTHIILCFSNDIPVKPLSMAQNPLRNVLPLVTKHFQALTNPTTRLANYATPTMCMAYNKQVPCRSTSALAVESPEPQLTDEEFSSSRLHAHRYWQHIPRWENVDEKDFLSYRWQARNNKTTQFDKSCSLLLRLPTRSKGRTNSCISYKR